MRFLRTTNVARMGYRPASARNAWMPKPTAIDLIRKVAASNALSVAPTSHSLRSLWGVVKDQGKAGSCTSQSTTKVIRLSLQRGGASLPDGIVDLSADDVYKTTRAIERAATAPSGNLPFLTDSGCEPDDCITAVSQFGVVPMVQGKLTSDGRYDDIEAATVNADPSLNIEERAAQMLFPGAYDVNFFASAGADQVRTINAQGIGQTLALFVDTQNVMGYDPNNGPITKIDLRDPQGGGHQVGISGYRNDPTLGLVIEFGNSWGITWGNAGFGEITWNCLLTAADAIIAYDVKLLASGARRPAVA